MRREARAEAVSRISHTAEDSHSLGEDSKTRDPEAQCTCSFQFSTRQKIIFKIYHWRTIREKKIQVHVWRFTKCAALIRQNTILDRQAQHVHVFDRDGNYVYHSLQVVADMFSIIIMIIQISVFFKSMSVLTTLCLSHKKIFLDKK